MGFLVLAMIGRRGPTNGDELAAKATNYIQLVRDKYCESLKVVINLKFS